jgi:GT2 family glycosyltransferase
MKDILTIAIPVFNRETYFRTALESALNQTLSVPVIVSDNASTKADFRKILGDYPSGHLSYYRNDSNLGIVGNWNRCIALCKTPFLLILHDDDFLHLTYAENFQKHWSPEVGFYFGAFEYIDGDGRITDRRPVGDLALFRDIEHWCTNNPAHVGAIFSVDNAKQLGGFNPKFHYTPDFDLWFRLALFYSWRQIPAFAGWYRSYHTAEQTTSAFARSGRIFGYRRNQWTRNRNLLRRTTGRPIPRQAGPGGEIRFTELLRMAPGLNDRWLRYVTAIYLRTPSATVFGTILRPILRFFGPTLPRMLVRLKTWCGESSGKGGRAYRKQA